jgi:hypothetical protein
MVTPASILAAPAHGVWPPLLIANWQPRLNSEPMVDKPLRIATAFETSWVEVGEKMQLGDSVSSCCDQYEWRELV